jgi:hypothetical protein
LAAPPTTDHVTVCVGVPVTVAINCIWPLTDTMAFDGVTVTVMGNGFTWTVAIPVTAPLALLVATTVTNVGEFTVAGAV